MRMSTLHEGDLVEANVRGRIFEAEVIDLEPRGWPAGWVEIEAVHHGCRGYRFVTHRQIKRRVRSTRRAA